MKIFYFFVILLISKSIFAQIILPNDYVCIFSETPLRGWGLKSKNITFYQEIMREEESEDFAKLNNYKKTKDKIYYKTGFKNNLFFYEIFLPESSKVILLTGDKETYELFCSYSTQLMAAVRKDRKYGSGYFIRKNGIVCNPQID